MKDNATKQTKVMYSNFWREVLVRGRSSLRCRIPTYGVDMQSVCVFCYAPGSEGISQKTQMDLKCFVVFKDFVSPVVFV